MTAKTDFQAKIKNAGGGLMAAHSGTLALAGEVWDLKAPAQETLVAARTLTINDSGKVFILGADSGAAITLPAVATSAGFYAKFIVGLAFTTTAWTIVAATAKIQGGVIVNSTHVAAANNTTITFAHAAETLGDWVEITCDGTNWYLNGVAKAAGGITCTGS